MNRNIHLNYQADSLIKIPKDNNQFVDVIEDENASIFHLPRESISDA